MASRVSGVQSGPVFQGVANLGRDFGALAAFLGPLVVIFGICGENDAERWHREHLGLSLGPFSEGSKNVRQLCQKTVAYKISGGVSGASRGHFRNLREKPCTMVVSKVSGVEFGPVFRKSAKNVRKL